jgi:histidinol-phosphate aminotransferase
MKQLTDKFEEWGLSYFPSQTNFVLVDFKQDSAELFQKLLKNGLIVRSGAALGFSGYQRITVGTPEQNAKLIAVLESLLSETASK